MLSWTMRYGGLIAAMVCTAISGHPPPIRTTRRSGLCRVWGRLVKAAGGFYVARRGEAACAAPFSLLPPAPNYATPRNG